MANYPADPASCGREGGPAWPSTLRDPLNREGAMSRRPKSAHPAGGRELTSICEEIPVLDPTTVRPRRVSVAIICFIPDYGHLQPLLKIADALQEAGFHIKCYMADECRPLLQRFHFDFFALRNTAGLKRRKEMTRAFRRSTFFNSVCLYLHYLLMYPRVAAGAGNSAAQLSKELLRQQPDLVICDALWFTEWYARIAGALGVPCLQNSFDGSLAYNQRPFVQTYGLSNTPRALQAAVEGISLLSKTLCASFYRLRYFRNWLELRAVRRAANAQFEAAFPLTGRPTAPPEWLVVGMAQTERRRLGGVLRLGGADRREFPALRFRSSVPLSAELSDWINSSDRPIVYVSFGSAVDIDAEFARAIYLGLRMVPAQVLWSLPTSQRQLLAGEPNAGNIRIESFVPQPEILCASKVKCFVTQGGPHSVQEALFGATPMLCIPFFVDQAYNSSIVERLGVGKRIWRKDVSAQSIASGITEILGDESFQKNATSISDDLVRREGGMAIAQYVTDLLKSRPSAKPQSISIQPQVQSKA
jgi:UDP:flavonoid glycosyltransferase YjiC (YdhE family)